MCIYIYMYILYIPSRFRTSESNVPGRCSEMVWFHLLLGSHNEENTLRRSTLHGGYPVEIRQSFSWNSPKIPKIEWEIAQHQSPRRPSPGAFRRLEPLETHLGRRTARHHHSLGPHFIHHRGGAVAVGGRFPAPEKLENLDFQLGKILSFMEFYGVFGFWTLENCWQCWRTFNFGADKNGGFHGCLVLAALAIPVTRVWKWVAKEI